MQDNTDLIRSHYNNVWNNTPNVFLFDKGPIDTLYYNFRVLEYPPTSNRNMWCYATCNMGAGFNSNKQIELHIFSSYKDASLIELLTAAAHYHKNTNGLYLNHTVNFGRSWQHNSLCTYGLISVPYLDGPQIEDFSAEGIDIKFYWLIPVTSQEVEYKKKHGIDALEEMFETKGLDYLHPDRDSLI